MQSGEKALKKELNKDLDTGDYINCVPKLTKRYNQKGCAVYHDLPPQKKVVKKTPIKKIRKTVSLQSMYSCTSDRGYDSAYQLASAIWPYIGDSNFPMLYRKINESYASVARCYIDKLKVYKLKNEKKIYTTQKGVNIYIGKFITNNGIGPGSAVYVLRQTK